MKQTKVMQEFFRRIGLLSFIIFFSFSALYSQDYKITGKILDASNAQPLIGANVIVSNVLDTLKKKFTTTDVNGQYAISGLVKGNYKIRVVFMGYNNITKTANVIFKSQVIDNISLSPKTQQLKEFDVVGTPPPAVLKGDTAEYNASAFKVTADANIEDLVKKMPGVTIATDGTVTAQGESVKKVLVDGKPFFGDDPSVALKNLPAEIVDKVQVFDQQSEQSQLTGFNDGNTSKTMNIVTRKDKRNGQFGKFNAAYGSDDRYSVGGNLNKFKNDARISVIALSNNINQQNFGTQDFLGAMGGTSSAFGSRGSSGSSSGSSRGGSSSSGSGSSSGGITTVNSIGLNYSNTFKNKLTLAASYFYNNTKNENYTKTNTQYILSTDSNKIDSTGSAATVKNFNNRLNFRAEWKIDSMNTLIVIPSVNFQLNKSNSSSDEYESLKVDDNTSGLTQSGSVSNTKTSGYSISNRLTFRHKFIKKNRTLSVDMNSTFNEKIPKTTSSTDLITYSTSDTTLTDRLVNTMNSGYTLETNVAYSEPVSDNSMLQLNLTNYDSKTYAYKKTNDLDFSTNIYSRIDTLSNKYTNYYIKNKVGLTYSVQTDRFNGSAGVEYQNANLSGDQTYPHVSTTDKSFNNLLPNVQMRYKMTQQTNAVLNYRTSTEPPSISQLQNVREYSSNMTKITEGNPDLKPQYQHNIFTRFMHVNRDKGTNFFLLFGGTINQNSIGNSTTYDSTYTIQTTKPVNKGTAYSLQSMTNFGLVIKPIKCNLNLSGGYNFNRTPGFVNGKSNISSTNAYSGTAVLSSNISEYVDFTLSSNGSYTTVVNTVSTSSNNNYYSQNSSFKFNWIFWKGFTLQNDISNKLYRGLSSSYNTNTTVVNLGIGKKFFNKAAEFRVTVYDLFNKNTSISRTVTANQITDTQSTILNRYVLASFTYTFRKFKTGSAPERKDWHRRDDLDGPPQGGGQGGQGGGGGAPMGPPPGDM
jgi:hypothetical protein